MKPQPRDQNNERRVVHLFDIDGERKINGTGRFLVELLKVRLYHDLYQLMALVSGKDNVSTGGAKIHKKGLI